MSGWTTWLAYVLTSGMAMGAVSISGPVDQSQAHDLSDAPQAFAEQTWTLVSSEVLGASVQLTAGPFVHVAQSSLKADCKLNLRVLSSGGVALWGTTVAGDQTNLALGKTSATVAAQSVALGDGTIGLTVTLQQSDFSILGAGSYSTTVVGTIAGNL